MIQKFLKQVEDVSNFLLYETATLGAAFVVPFEGTLSRLERFKTELIAPRHSFANLVKPSITVEIYELLFKALSEMRVADVSQIPVYENGTFRELLKHVGLFRSIVGYVLSCILGSYWYLSRYLYKYLISISNEMSTIGLRLETQ
jgi:hypothetical protein